MLSNNAIEAIPADEVAPLRELRKLSLSHNKLSELPSLAVRAFGRCPCSTRLSRDSFLLCPWQTCTALKEVRVNENALVALPESLAKCLQ